jgi:hypothetical protein
MVVVEAYSVTVGVPSERWMTERDQIVNEVQRRARRPATFRIVDRPVHAPQPSCERSADDRQPLGRGWPDQLLTQSAVVFGCERRAPRRRCGSDSGGESPRGRLTVHGSGLPTAEYASGHHSRCGSAQPRTVGTGWDRDSLPEG